jgi:hypothetical protein
MAIYKVKPRDCLTRIAADHGFSDYKTIYDHPDNAAFKAKRPNPHVIQPGDEVFIPPVRQRTETLSTGMIHRIVIKRPAAEIRLYIKDADGDPFARKRYILRADGDSGERRGSTDDAGLVQQAVPPSATRASLEFPDDGVVFHLRLGGLDPLGEESGLRGRLENLGFPCGPDGDTESEANLRRALARFQAQNELEATGELDTTTLSRLRDLHDGGEES